MVLKSSQPIREQIIASAIYDHVASLTYAPPILTWVLIGQAMRKPTLRRVKSNSQTQTSLEELLCQLSVSTEHGNTAITSQMLLSK